MLNIEYKSMSMFDTGFHLRTALAKMHTNQIEITYKLQNNKYSTLVINFPISKNFLFHINLNIKQPLIVIYLSFKCHSFYREINEKQNFET
jgi:hypothetical protein